MARPRAVYSESHDSSVHPRNSGGKRRKVAQAPQVTPPIPTPNTQVGLLPPNLSDEQRRNLRARQLMAERRVAVPENLAPPGADPTERAHPPLEDWDLKVDMARHHPRGPQDNRFDGWTDTVFPLVNGPQPTHTQTRVLPDHIEHPPLPDFDARHIHAATDLIAAVSAEDGMILAFDNQLTVMHTTLRGLRQKAQSMLQAVSQSDDNPGLPDSPTSHARNVVQMIATIIEPWFGALDDEFGKLLEGTEQGEAVEEEAMV